MARHNKDAYLTPPDTEREDPSSRTIYKVVGTPPPQPVFYGGQLIGWKVYGEEALYPASIYRRKSHTRLFEK